MTRHALTLQTTAHEQVQDLTLQVRQLVRQSGVAAGLCLVYCPHTTAGLVINEGYDPDVASDVLALLDRLAPWHGPYQHAEGNAAAHAKAILTGTSQTILVENGDLALGTWQALQFYEFDGPRTRTVVVTLMEATS
jgi:secondary thiamine-phosphate synthase enzyme